MLKQKIKVWRGTEKGFAWKVSRKELREMTPKILRSPLPDVASGLRISESDLSELKRYVENPDLFGGDVEALESHLKGRFAFDILSAEPPSWYLNISGNLSSSLRLLSAYDQLHGTHHASGAILHLLVQGGLRLGLHGLIEWAGVLGEISDPRESARIVVSALSARSFLSASLSASPEFNAGFSIGFGKLLSQAAQAAEPTIPLDLLTDFTFHLVMNSYDLSNSGPQLLAQRRCARRYTEALQEYFSLLHETALAEALDGALAVIDQEAEDHFRMEGLRAPYWRLELEQALARSFPFHRLN